MRYLGALRLPSNRESSYARALASHGMGLVLPMAWVSVGDYPHMAASLSRLRTRTDRLTSEAAEAARQRVLPLVEDQLLGPPARAFLAAIDQREASDKGWTFVMLSPAQNNAVVHFITNGGTKRPLVAVQVWSLCFEHLHRDTGEIMLSRVEIAEIVGVKPAHISEIMSDLARFGAVSRVMQRGEVRWFVNPRVATHLAGQARDKAQAKARQLKLVPLAIS